MLLSVNVTSPDYPDVEYVFDMYARPGVSAAGGQLHRVGGRDVLRFSSIFGGSGCEEMLVVSILQRLQTFAFGDKLYWVSNHFGNRFFGGEQEAVNKDISVTFFHRERYWSFGLSYHDAECVAEWLYEEFPDEQLRAPVYHRWTDENELQSLEIHAWLADQDQLPTAIQARLEAQEHAISLLSEAPFPPGIRIAHEWLTEQLVLVGKTSRKASLIKLVEDFKGFRRLCRQLLPVIGSEATDVHYAEMTMLDFLNAYELNQDRGGVVEWTDHKGTVHWLYPNAFMALKIVDNQPVVIKLDFKLPREELSEQQEQLLEFGDYLPLDDVPLADEQVMTDEQPLGGPEAQEATAPPASQTVFRIPFGALNPKTDEADESLDDEAFEEDDFDFDDFDLSDLDLDFDFDDMPSTISEGERELIYRFPDFDLARTAGKVVVWADLRETTHLNTTPVGKLLDHMVGEGITGQFIYTTQELDLIRSSVVRHGELWYAPVTPGLGDAPPISWQRINDALVSGNDASIRALLSMMFMPPAH